MKSAREFAVQKLRRDISRGWLIEDIANSQQGGFGPQRGDEPSYQYVIGSGTVPVIETRKHPRMKVKRGQIGVIVQWADGKYDAGVFSIKELCKEAIDDKPKQLSLFDEVMS